MNKSGLWPYQPPHVQRLVKASKEWQVFVDMSDLGTGKTVCGAAVCREQKVRPAIVCSASGIAAWHKWCAHIGVEPLFVETYDKLKGGSKYFLEKIERTRVVKGEEKKTREFVWTMDKNTILIFDEAHKLRNKGTQNSEILMAAFNQGIRIELVSATLAETPMQFEVLGVVLGLFPHGGFWRWVQGYGCRQIVFGQRYRVPKSDPRFNRRIMEFTKNKDEQKKHMNRIRERVLGTGRGSRMAIADLGNLFPENLITAEAYTIDAASAIQKLYAEMKKEIKKLRKQADSAKHHFVAKLRQWQEIELLKAPTFVELARNAVEEGCSVVLFVNFQATLDYLVAELECPYISGEVSVEDRGRIEREFQADEFRVLACNVAAGGESLSFHDLHGVYPRRSYLSPTHSATKLRQSLGRLPRAGAKSKVVQQIVFAGGTVEAGIAGNVQRKLKNIDSLNDGDLIGGLFEEEAGIKDAGNNLHKRRTGTAKKIVQGNRGKARSVRGKRSTL